MTLWDQITDADRDALVREILGALPTAGIPEHLRGGLVRYFADGILPGGFLQAALRDDIDDAMRRADAVSRGSLPALRSFLQTYAPARSWGSREAVLAWTTTPDRLDT